MTDKQRELLSLIKYQATIESLSTELKLSVRQVYQRILKLQNSGYEIHRKDFATGDVQFDLSSSPTEENSVKAIYTSPSASELRALVISDTHLGNTLQSLGAINEAYNYCIQNNIHVIFNCGDLFNGLCNSKHGKSVNDNYEEQLAYAIKDYPFDSKIINYVVLGNHDTDYQKGYIDIKKALMSKRYDIFPVGYNEATIKVKNDGIKLVHPNGYEPPKYNKKIIFRGHSHISKITNNFSVDSAYVYVPTCSNVFYDQGYEFPEVLDVTFSFNGNGIIESLNISTLAYVSKYVKVGEYSHRFRTFLGHGEIKYEEEPKVPVVKPAEKTLERKTVGHPLSQKI